jgi:thioredoxin 1
MNNSDFQRRISQTDKPVIVDFWAPWCVPCRITKPILEKLASEYNAKVDFLAVNADEARDLSDQFDIVGIPTVLALHEGKVLGRITGAQNESGYRAMFESLLNGKEVKIQLSASDRILRLTAGTLLVMIGISTSSWLVLGMGGVVAFLAVYDRCPLWAGITKQWKKTGMD